MKNKKAVIETIRAKRRIKKKKAARETIMASRFSKKKGNKVPAEYLGKRKGLLSLFRSDPSARLKKEKADMPEGSIRFKEAAFADEKKGDLSGMRKVAGEKANGKPRKAAQKTASVPKPKVAIVRLASCGGCVESLLESDEAFLEFLNGIELVDAGKEDQRLELALVEGKPLSDEDVEKLKSVRFRTRILATLGNRVGWGEVPEMKNYQRGQSSARQAYRYLRGAVDPEIRSVEEFVKVDFFLAGCPIDGEEFLKYVPKLLKENVPEISGQPVRSEARDGDPDKKEPAIRNQEGACSEKTKDRNRMIENVLIGRECREVPMIVQRACGNCSVAYDLVSTRAIEKAMGITVSQETEKLRKLMACAQLIRSHAGNFLPFSVSHPGIASRKDVKSRSGEDIAKANSVRRYGSMILKAIGGRSVHPIANGIGGFSRIPERKELKDILRFSEKALEDAIDLGKVAGDKGKTVPSKKGKGLSLGKRGEYALYGGNVIADGELIVSAEHFQKDPAGWSELAKKAGHCRTGAIARIANNHSKLYPSVRNYLKGCGSKADGNELLPASASRLAETIQCIEESVRLIEGLLNSEPESVLDGKGIAIREGAAAAAVEAPDGLLCFRIEIDPNGYVRDANVLALFS